MDLYCSLSESYAPGFGISKELNCFGSSFVVRVGVNDFSLTILEKTQSGPKEIPYDARTIATTFSSFSIEDKQKIEASIIRQEREQFSGEIDKIKNDFNSPELIRAFLKSNNLALSSNYIFGPLENDVFSWLGNEYSGYPDLAHKLIFLFKRGLIKPPKDNNMSLLRINAAYQKVLSKSYDNPTTDHSLIILKEIYSQMYEVFYGH